MCVSERDIESVRRSVKKNKRESEGQRGECVCERERNRVRYH